MVKPITIGITQGDINGIGYELIIKTLLDARMLEVCTPVVYGSSKVLSYHKKITPHGGEFNYNVIHQAEQAHTRKCNILNITDQELKVDLGEATPVSGQAALDALEMATRDLTANKLAALVTAPINKKCIQSDHFHFSGHTEYFARKTESSDYLMLMVANSLRIGTVTTHCALDQVSKNLSKELILNKIHVLNQSLVQDFACTKPRIAVLALNPHAGEQGMFGNEEQDFIIPAIREAFEQKIYAFGPFPADGFFASGQYAQYDAILAMYHDQAMIPFKLLSYGEGVNYTAGLPVIRTSPAHGTAYDIVGKGVASTASFRNAIYLACDIYANRHRAQLDEELEIVAKKNEGAAFDE